MLLKQLGLACLAVSANGTPVSPSTIQRLVDQTFGSSADLLSEYISTLAGSHYQYTSTLVSALIDSASQSTGLDLASSPPTVALAQGTYAGTTVNSTLDQYLGIPFAQPPTGSLRFRAPQAINTSSSAVTQATTSGNACPQGTDASAVSEDCLVLNVHVPTGTAASAGLPVYVHFYGGSLAGGYADGPGTYRNPTAILTRAIANNQPFIWVASNYRIGIFGFMASSDMSASDLNAGLLDQKMTLQWVQDNIASFGGDPTKVVMGGDSAGGFSVGHHLLYSDSSLYRGAIMQSGFPTTGGYLSIAQAQSYYYTPLLTSSGCSDFACIQALPFATVFAANSLKSAPSGVLPYQPCYDGVLVTAPPAELIEGGSFAKVPMIMGDVRDEGTLFSPTGVTSDAQIVAGLSAVVVGQKPPINGNISQILTAYPNTPALGSPYDTGTNLFGLNAEYKRVSSIAGDFTFHSNRRRFAQYAASSGVKAWNYQLGTTSSALAAASHLGISHGSEIIFIFLHETTTFAYQVADYWINFITGLDPNGDSLPQWNDYGPSAALLNLTENAVDMTTDDFRSSAISLLQSINSVPPTDTSYGDSPTSTVAAAGSRSTAATSTGKASPSSGTSAASSSSAAALDSRNFASLLIACIALASSQMI
ncbi:uncharacterized protein L969DRAFT_93710 [Mixia osmundae IAM 14324]|uniref:Carboxylesterase type B domain-containing protein n=1 Tax=Mixia osmundae (strain CBS 9802 / IAM 14324 / JCM 22182 / KY 12970) TaxID=764103 RepID=G7E9C9_MIXOS|nr:uncharacterized protein L969DRAFT_93710 [Mixia osmundae IAM 14324]KEI39878.1 hypothetical protein L969DRAFT_93710 [Mixia osmundae IAM 14324]GAA99248.1 hypothetical protein E5Q_05942 [Mixia osmundae IAM 14324]